MTGGHARGATPEGGMLCLSTRMEPKTVRCRNSFVLHTTSLLVYPLVLACKPFLRKSCASHDDGFLFFERRCVELNGSFLICYISLQLRLYAL